MVVFKESFHPVQDQAFIWDSMKRAELGKKKNSPGIWPRPAQPKVDKSRPNARPVFFFLCTCFLMCLEEPAPIKFFSTRVPLC